MDEVDKAEARFIRPRPHPIIQPSSHPVIQPSIHPVTEPSIAALHATCHEQH